MIEENGKIEKLKTRIMTVIAAVLNGREKSFRKRRYGGTFLVRLVKEDLEKMGFDNTVLQNCEYADVYLLWQNDDFSIKIVWHGSEIQTYIEDLHQTPNWLFNFIVEKYIES